MLKNRSCHVTGYNAKKCKSKYFITFFYLYLFRKISMLEQREITNHNEVQGMNNKIQELNDLITQSEKSVQNKNSELEEASREMLQLKDMKLDFEGKLENID